jgi:glycosyltransferase involved in cell wall biosynthesis
MKGWLVNDCLTVIPGSRTLWHDLLEWLPGLEDQTGGYTPFDRLVARIMMLPGPPPDYLIRNATFFGPLPMTVPTIALLQDCTFGIPRSVQLEVCNRATLTVVNSAYTASLYPELPFTKLRTIPIGVDFDHFTIFPEVMREMAREKWGIPRNAVCFIGADSAIKGFCYIDRLIHETGLAFCLVMKDDTSIEIPGRVRTFNKVNHDDLVEIINACSIGFCPSVRETQHLAGLEMGACGLPLVTSDVGIYHRRAPGPWGMRAEPDEYAECLLGAIGLIDQRAREAARAYWECRGVTREACAASWRKVVEEATGCALASPQAS